MKKPLRILLIAAFIVSQALMLYLALGESEASHVLTSFYSGWPMHFAAFFGTILILYLILSQHKVKYPLILLFAYAVSMGGLIEILQHFLPGRQTSVEDFLFDILGAAAGIAVLKLFPHAKKFLEGKDDEDRLYNSMIIALVAGIFIVIVSLVIMRPQPEYFTELYYGDPDNLQKFIEPGEEYSFEFTIRNHEASEYTYDAETVAVYTGTRIEQISKEKIVVPKDGETNRTVTFNLTGFDKARIETRLVGKDQEIHFFVYNNASFLQFPDFLARVSCLNATVVDQMGDMTIYAHGQWNPNMKVYLNKELVLVANVSDNSTGYVLPSAKGYLDIVFDNDYYNQSAKIDRNLFIEKVMIGNISLKGILDTGRDSQAFDCENTKVGQLYGNGAMRYLIR